MIARVFNVIKQQQLSPLFGVKLEAEKKVQWKLLYNCELNLIPWSMMMTIVHDYDHRQVDQNLTVLPSKSVTFASVARVIEFVT